MRSMRYVQRILDLVYSHGCIKREAIISSIKEIEGADAKRIENGVKQALKRLVRKGLIIRKSTGYYCKP